MEKGTNYKLKLGIFVTIGTSLLILSMYYIGDKQNLFGSNFQISALFSHVSGLQKGNNVRYSGINIGTVKDIRILNDTAIIVDMIIKEEMMEFIKKDAIAAIGTDGLMGDQLVNINPGSPLSPLVQELDTINSLGHLDSERMLRGLGQTGTNVEIISSNLVDIVEKINTGEGTIGKLVHDKDLANHLSQTLINLDIVCSRLSSLTLTVEEKLIRGEGTIGTLLSDTAMAGNIRTITKDLKVASASLNETTEKLNDMMTDLKGGQGVAGAMLTDTNMVNSLEESLENVRQGTASFNENMEAMKENWLFRGYFKDQEKEAKKAAKKK